LIADSFKNWRGITEAGGRRIKSSFNIDLNSVHFLSDKEMEQLGRLQLLSGYRERKRREIEGIPLEIYCFTRTTSGCLARRSSPTSSTISWR